MTETQNLDQDFRLETLRKWYLCTYPFKQYVLYIFGNPEITTDTQFRGVDFQKETQIFYEISPPVFKRVKAILLRQCP